MITLSSRLSFSWNRSWGKSFTKLILSGISYRITGLTKTKYFFLVVVIDLSHYLFAKKDNTFNTIQKEENLNLQLPLVTTLFDYQRWNRPLRYIKNDYFDNVVRNENSQFFFHICQSDGKERISFTYPPNLSTFLKIMERKMDRSPTHKSVLPPCYEEKIIGVRSIHKDK